MIDLSFLPKNMQESEQIHKIVEGWSDAFYELLKNNMDSIGKSIGVLDDTLFGLDLKATMLMGEKAAFDDAYGRVMGEIMIEKMKKENENGGK